MTECPKCGTKNPDYEASCIRCGEPLVNATTRSLGDTDFEEGIPKWGSARFNGMMLLKLDVLKSDQSFEFLANEITELAIGRVDPDSGNAPEVDLTPSDAIDKGVSRHHATVVRRDGALHIVDNDSANGTYLNGQRLVARQPRILRDGDDIRLGHLVVRVTFNVGGS